VGRGPAPRVWRAGAAAVLGPLVVVAVIAASANVAVVHVHATILGDGSWAWLGDAAVVLDVLAALALLGVPATFRTELVARSGIGEVDVMSGGEFEAHLAALFSGLGYAVARTRASGDFGADLLLERDHVRLVVQAKRYDGSVGIEAVQQVIGATRYYGATRALVVTNSVCTPAAVALAGAHGVELVEREELVRLLAARPSPVARGAVVQFAHEVGSGLTLVAFAVGMVLRLAWWTLRAGLRASAAVWRGGR
jgi:restriction system protein